jgi:nucleotide-binding universal stress UspA family protein
VNAFTAIVEGDPKDAICEASEELHADLLVVGSRGLGMVKRYLNFLSIHVILSI